MPKVIKPNPVLKQAIALARLGYRVLPIELGGKKPLADLAPHGLKDATADVETIRRWFTQRPDANLAVETTGLCVVDVDPVNGQTNPWQAELETPMASTTPRGGGHSWFADPTGKLKNTASKIAPNVDTRSTGGYVLVAPSRVDGRPYQWTAGPVAAGELPSIPSLILDELTKAKGATPQPTTTDPIRVGDIPEGRRNNELFNLACKLRDIGIGEDSVLRAVQSENSARCKPPLTENEVSGIVQSAVKAGSHGSHGSQTNADLLLGIAISGSELWHTPDSVGMATIHRNNHQEHWPLKSRNYRQWLSKQFYDQKSHTVGAQTMQDVINILEGKAHFDGPTHPVSVRVAEHEGSIYLDLANDSWQAIEIDSAGWRIVESSPVRFRRAKGMLALPLPERGGSIDELRRFVNVSNDDWPLLIAWVVAAFRPVGPYPILKMTGEQGSAKTTTAQVLRCVIDPNTAPVRSAPRSEHDLMIAASNGWVVNLDNLSRVSPDLSDALCRLATGSALATRTLYENDEETLFVAQRPIILNGIEDIGTRSDLLDRALIVSLPRINPKQRLTEKVFWHDFETALPRILGSLLDAVSAALHNLPAVEQSETVWLRMADFCQWAVAAETAMGLKPGEFLKAYSDNRETANQTALESSPVVASLFELLKKKGGQFEGTATDLLNKLSIGQDTRTTGWPKLPKVLSGILKRLAPNLRTAGLTVEEIILGSGNSKRKGWRIANAVPNRNPTEDRPKSATLATRPPQVR